jgi:tetratricopeptide (TPR) repeat protein
MRKTLILWLFLLGSFQSNSQSLEELIPSANAKAAEYDFKGAFADFRKAAQIDSVNTSLLYSRGDAWLKVMQLDSALKDFKTAKRRSRDPVGLNFHIAKTKFYKSDYSGAVAELDEVIAIREDLLLYYELRGKVKLRGKQYHGAIMDLTTIIRKREYPVDLLMRGIAYTRISHDSLARLDFLRIIELEKSQKGILTPTALYYLGYKKQAFEKQTELCSTNNHKDNLYHLATLFALEDDTPKALEYLELAFVRGYREFGTLSQEEAFDQLRGSLEYKQLLWKYSFKY